jgi:hypothetical protein
MLRLWRAVPLRKYLRILRPRLETARLDLLALFRALDRMDLTPVEIAQRLIPQLFELDADYVEALWALDRPVGNLHEHALLCHTLAALEQLPQACARFRAHLPSRAHPTLVRLETELRNRLNPIETYSMNLRPRSPKRLSTRCCFTVVGGDECRVCPLY